MKPLIITLSVALVVASLIVLWGQRYPVGVGTEGDVALTFTSLRDATNAERQVWANYRGERVNQGATTNARGELVGRNNRGELQTTKQTTVRWAEIKETVQGGKWFFDAPRDRALMAGVVNYEIEILDPNWFPPE